MTAEKYSVEWYRDLNDRMMKALRLDTGPATLFYSIKPPPGLPKTDRFTKLCTFIDDARFDGKAFYTSVEDHECKNAIWIFGLGKPSLELLSGDWHGGKPYPENGRANWATPVAARRGWPRDEIAEGSIKYISYAPLNNCPIRPEIGGGIVWLSCTPHQAMYLAYGDIYESGGEVAGITGGPPTCMATMLYPFTRGKMYYSLGCHGGRLFCRVKTEELPIGFPIEHLEYTVNAVETQLRDRPDLNKMLDEPVGTYHIATEEDINVQISKEELPR
jgi:uncharacterized protein (DUF169 family)